LGVHRGPGVGGKRHGRVQSLLPLLGSPLALPQRRGGSFVTSGARINGWKVHIPYHPTASRSVSLSSQSSFHHSLTGLVRYRSRAGYLVLGEAHLPVRAAIPNSTTRVSGANLRDPGSQKERRQRGFNPLWQAPFQVTWPAPEDPRMERTAVTHPTALSFWLVRPAGMVRRPPELLGWTHWSCPVHSPLLGASPLLSFPGLIDMLKLSP
jgi:hypothetical protein